MKKVYVFICTVILLCTTLSYSFGETTTASSWVSPDNGVACTQEAKMCPDGKSWVSRTGSNCEFAKCPTDSDPISPPTIACTQEAKMCSDGKTWVSRTGPNCEFAACPTEIDNFGKTCPLYDPAPPKNGCYYVYTKNTYGCEIANLKCDAKKQLSSAVIKKLDTTLVQLYKKLEIKFNTVDIEEYLNKLIIKLDELVGKNARYEPFVTYVKNHIQNYLENIGVNDIDDIIDILQ